MYTNNTVCTWVSIAINLKQATYFVIYNYKTNWARIACNSRNKLLSQLTAANAKCKLHLVEWVLQPKKQLLYTLSILTNFDYISIELLLTTEAEVP